MLKAKIPVRLSAIVTGIILIAAAIIISLSWLGYQFTEDLIKYLR